MNTLTAPPILERISVLGDETRARILALLEVSEFTVSELCAALQTPQPTVSRHLRTLASEGWVEARTEGRNRHYRLSTDLDAASSSLWALVRSQVDELGSWARDRERALRVLEERRLRATEYFARSAKQWDEIRVELFGSATGLAPLLGLLDPTWVVADLGVGTGALAARLAPFVGSVVGFDRSEEMLTAARARLADSPNVELRQAELEALPIPSGSVDLAVLALVLHYTVDPPAVLREARRILRPGGRAVLLDMRLHDRGDRLAEEMGHVWPGFAPSAMESWLLDAGFETARIHPLPPDPNASGPLLFLSSATT